MTIDTLELNAGVIPTYPGQGDYSSWSEYQSALAQLIGVDYTNYDVIVEIEGITMKVDDNDNPVAYGDNPGSSSKFFHDALSDEDGRIYVDNQDVTGDLLRSHQIGNYDVEVDGQPLSGNSINLQGHDGPFEWMELTTLEDSPWTADFSLDAECEQSINCAMTWGGTVIRNVEVHGQRCIWLYDTVFDIVQVHCPSPDFLQVTSDWKFDGSWKDEETSHVEGSPEIEQWRYGKTPAEEGCSDGLAIFDSNHGKNDSDLLSHGNNCPLQ